MMTFAQLFANHKVEVAQALISRGDLQSRSRYINVRNTLDALLSIGAIPIINENDSVSIEEISFGDNDTLAGAIVGLVDADRFIMLTDEEGVFSQDAKKHENVKLLKQINLDDQSIELDQITEGSAGVLGRGGMKTKIKALRADRNDDFNGA